MFVWESLCTVKRWNENFVKFAKIKSPHEEQKKENIWITWALVGFLDRSQFCNVIQNAQATDWRRRRCSCCYYRLKKVFALGGTKLRQICLRFFFFSKSEKNRETWRTKWGGCGLPDCRISQHVVIIVWESLLCTLDEANFHQICSKTNFLQIAKKSRDMKKKTEGDHEYGFIWVSNFSTDRNFATQFKTLE